MLLTMDDLWSREARDRSVAAGEVLFRTGDPVRILYRVEFGAIKLVRNLPHGSELTIQRARGGALLAEASLFATSYHCDAVAVSAAGVRGVPVQRILEALKSDPGLTLALARYLALEVQAARTRAEITSLRTVRTRLDAWLAFNGDGLPPRGRWREVAEEIGVTPEALYRELATRTSRT